VDRWTNKKIVQFGKKLSNSFVSKLTTRWHFAFSYLCNSTSDPNIHVGVLFWELCNTIHNSCCRMCRMCRMSRMCHPRPLVTRASLSFKHLREVSQQHSLSLETLLILNQHRTACKIIRTLCTVVFPCS
jgi:hypothetical protein